MGLVTNKIMMEPKMWLSKVEIMSCKSSYNSHNRRYVEFCLPRNILHFIVKKRYLSVPFLERQSLLYIFSRACRGTPLLKKSKIHRETPTILDRWIRDTCNMLFLSYWTYLSHPLLLLRIRRTIIPYICIIIILF